VAADGGRERGERGGLAFSFIGAGERLLASVVLHCGQEGRLGGINATTASAVTGGGETATQAAAGGRGRAVLTSGPGRSAAAGHADGWGRAGSEAAAACGRLGWAKRLRWRGELGRPKTGAGKGQAGRLLVAGQRREGGEAGPILVLG
jgi:hypothetical protein